MDEQQTSKLIDGLTAKIALLEAENAQLKETQQRIAEINNNYLMLHYLTSNIQACQTTQELWKTYLHAVSDCGFNYDYVAVLLPDDNACFSISLSLQNGEIIQSIVDMESDYLLQAVADKLPAISPNNLQAVVPIVKRTGVVRAVLLVEKARGIFAEDLQLLDVYVRQTAATVDNIILNENLRYIQELLGQQLDQFIMLHYVTKSIHDAGNYYDVLKNYLKTLCSPLGFGFQDGVLYIFAENELQKASLHGDELFLVAPTGCEGRFVEDMINVSQYKLSPDGRHLIMPLSSCGNTTAVIEINHDNEITPEQIRILDIFAMQTSSAIDNTRLKHHLEYLSFHDQLTGLYNRAFFEKEVQRIENKACYPVGIIVCDLDGLKLVNDTWGHDAGDKFIAAAAQLIVSAIPEHAVAARVGGDEFAIVFSGSPVPNIEEVGLNLRKAVIKYNEEMPDIPVGMSIGWAVSDQPVPVIEVFQQADEKMYQDKFFHGKASREYIARETKLQIGRNTARSNSRIS